MPISNPLVAGSRELQLGPDIQASPLAGTRVIDGVAVNPLIGGSLVDLALQQRAQQEAEYTQATTALTQQAVVPPAPAAAPAPAQEQGDFMRGLSTYVPQTKGILAGALGLALDRFGAEEVGQDLLNSAKASFDAAAALGKKNDQFTEALKPEGSLTDWAQFVAGQMTGNVLESLAVAVAGGAVGAAAGGAVGLAPGAVVGGAGAAGTSLVARSLVKTTVREAIEKTLRETTEAGVKAGLTREAASAAANQQARAALGRATGQTIGATSALLTAAATRGTGEVVQQAQAAGLDPREIAGLDLASSVGVYALAETLSDKLMLRAFGGTRTGSLPTYVLRRGGSGGLVEGGTETIQDIATSLGAGAGMPSADSSINSFAAGFAGGGMVHSAGAATSRRAAAVEQTGDAGAAADAEADGAPSGAPGLPPPGGLDAGPTLPTGLDALDRQQRTLTRVAAATAVRGVKVPELDPTTGEPTGKLVDLSVEGLLADPDLTLQLARAAGQKVDGLEAFLADMQAQIRSAEVRTEVAASLDNSMRSALAGLDEAERAQFAADMGWTLEQLTEGLRGATVANLENAPESLRLRLGQAASNANRAARERGEAENSARWSAWLQAEADARAARQAQAQQEAQAELAAREAAAVEAQQRNAEITRSVLGRDPGVPVAPMRESSVNVLARLQAQQDTQEVRAELAARQAAAAEAQQRNAEITQSVLGRDPNAPPAAAPARVVNSLTRQGAQQSALDEAANAWLTSPAQDRFNPLQYGPNPPTLPTRERNARLALAFSRGDAAGVRRVLLEAANANVRGARRTLEEFNLRIEALSGGTTRPFP